eukprot:11608819-Heterocapsa_arctica.AAC.1
MPFLIGESRKEIREEELLLYVVHQGVTMARAAGTVKAKLFGVRKMHIVAGYPDPLVNKRRLWMAIKGLERRRGPARRKMPTTPGMLKWIRTQLNPEQCPNDADGRIRSLGPLGPSEGPHASGPPGQVDSNPINDYAKADELLLR